jgi:hypothetical protein
MKRMFMFFIYIAITGGLLISCTVDFNNPYDPFENGSEPFLPRTGQITCYDNTGAVISCDNTGQDGEYQRGVQWPSMRFWDNDDGTITDNLTGLTWLKNANCWGNVYWDTALSNSNNLADGQCSLTDGSSANDWRLPNKRELRSLVNYGTDNLLTWLTSQGFTNIPGGGTYHWTSTTDASFTDNAFTFDMQTGMMNSSDKDAVACAVWPVKY